MTAGAPHATMWFLLCGGVFVVMALAGSVLKRLPLSASIIYLGIGFVIGPYGLGLLKIHAMEHAGLLERVAEIGVLISLFTAGLKLRAPIRDKVWWPALRLATIGMVLTIVLLSLAGHLLLGLPWWAAILLAAVLSPTDPVLASDVQTRDIQDNDRVRFSLTTEAGLNDGTAFPFIMLALGIAGLHELGTFGSRWVLVDVVWATAAGLGVGAILGMAVARLVVYLRKEHKEATGLDDFIALGLVALSYGAALLVHGYGFLAVFAAGLALRREERVNSPDHGPVVPREKVDIAGADSMEADVPESPEEQATHPQHAPAYMAHAVLEFNQGLERVTEVVLVVLTGALLSSSALSWNTAIIAVLLLLLIRPIAAFASLAGTSTAPRQRRMIMWFGIRGIGSLYYLFYALNHAGSTDYMEQLLHIVTGTVAVSIIVHGITVTPLMQRYEKREKQRPSEMHDSAESAEVSTP